MELKYQYLPEVHNGIIGGVHREGCPVPKQEPVPEPKGMYPCPCCGCKTFPVPPKDDLSYICPVCFWENDQFIQSADEPSDQNHGMTLNEAKVNYKAIGACCESMLRHVRPPREEELPD